MNDDDRSTPLELFTVRSVVCTTYKQARLPGCTLLCEETDLGWGFAPI